MIKSMTAFGRASDIRGGKEITVEIKSVNNRYADISVRVSRMYSFLEEKIKSYLQSHGISRGKIEVNCTVNVLDALGTEIHLDQAYTKSYLGALRELRDTFGLTDDISVMTVAQNRDIFTVIQPEEDMEKDWADVQTVVERALAAHTAMRQNEGARIAEDLTGKVQNLRRMVNDLSAHAADATEAYRVRLESKLRQVLEENHIDAEPDHARIITECALFADKTAIDEEIVRLGIHFDALENAFQSEEPVGRKLDFLMQEMNRETNTIGSKANDFQIAKTVVDMKAEIEKIREQIQNLE